MAAAVIVSIAVGIWVAAAYMKNKFAWDSARTAKGRLAAAQKKRWSGALGLLWPIGGIIVLGALAFASPDQSALTPDGGISSAFFTLTISALLLGGWFIFRYADTSRTWKGIAELKSGLSDARKKRWATLWPAVLAVVVLLGVVVALVSAQSG
jgi:heme/copper-type cytochrome/quinol oxidase subunit 2